MPRPLRDDRWWSSPLLWVEWFLVANIGAVLILVGLYVGYYGYYEVRLFNAGGSPEDPVIAAAGRMQGALAGWVHRHGPWPWIVVLTALIVVALIWAWSKRRSRAGRAMVDDEP